MNSLPEHGSVIRYAYLWAREHAYGQPEGREDRPALVIALSVLESDGTTRVYAAAITHTRPASETDAVALPARVRRSLGLDESPSWIVTTEVNAFVWPGPDIRPISDRQPTSFIYGRIPVALLDTVVASYLANSERRQTTVVSRSN